MSHVANINGMSARRTTQVVVVLRSQGVQRRERPFMLATHAGTGFAGGLQCQAPNKGNGHLCRRLSCIPSRKAECVPMWDLFRASLKQHYIERFLRILRFNLQGNRLADKIGEIGETL